MSENEKRRSDAGQGGDTTRKGETIAFFQITSNAGHFQRLDAGEPELLASSSDNPAAREPSSSHGQIPGRTDSHLSAEERQVLARAEIVSQKRLLTVLKNEFRTAIQRIRKAQQILAEAE